MRKPQHVHFIPSPCWEKPAEDLVVGDGFRVQPSRGRSQPSGIPQDVARQYSQFSILEKTCLCWKTRLKSMHFSQYYPSINIQLRGGGGGGGDGRPALSRSPEDWSTMPCSASTTSEGSRRMRRDLKARLRRNFAPCCRGRFNASVPWEI